MKKNSIEEDIVITKKLITTKFNNDYSIDNKDKEAIEHILTDYKRVLKETEELKTELKDSVIAIKLYALQTENEKQKKLIEKMKKYLLKENKMCDFLESEE